MIHKISRRASFYIYLSALIMLFCFLVIDLISAIYFPFGIAEVLRYGERVANYYAFFTTQTNYLVALYFAFHLYVSHFKRTIPHFSIRLAVTVYISITMLVFWFGIFSNIQDPQLYTFYNWINTIILHLIMPIVMIINFIFTSGRELIAIRKWHQNYLWLIAIYPAIYSIIILVRGYLRYLDFNNYGHPPENTWYPYEFFNWNRPYGWLIASAAVVIIFGLVFGLQYFYIWINNIMYRRSRSEEERLEFYYTKTLEKLGKRIRKRKK